MDTNKIQLFSMATPNGQKASIALEEMGIPYEAHLVDIMAGDQFKPQFIQMNPNSKIPAILDPNGPGEKPLSIMESGAILIYLAEKSGKFLSTDPVDRSTTLQWLFWQVGGLGPMFGQFGHFYKYAVEKSTTDCHSQGRNLSPSFKRRAAPHARPTTTPPSMIPPLIPSHLGAFVVDWVLFV